MKLIKLILGGEWLERDPSLRKTLFFFMLHHTSVVFTLLLSCAEEMLLQVFLLTIIIGKTGVVIQCLSGTLKCLLQHDHGDHAAEDA